eukprot:SAG31_NODE_4402_length_3267_cov_1.552715_5_plen_159_part_00
MATVANFINSLDPPQVNPDLEIVPAIAREYQPHLVPNGSNGIIDSDDSDHEEIGKGCYFLVFVQLFEKYGTLIERYTALIEKVSALIVRRTREVNRRLPNLDDFSDSEEDGQQEEAEPREPEPEPVRAIASMILCSLCPALARLYCFPVSSTGHRKTV